MIEMKLLEREILNPRKTSDVNETNAQHQPIDAQPVPKQ